MPNKYEGEAPPPMREGIDPDEGEGARGQFMRLRAAERHLQQERRGKEGESAQTTAEFLRGAERSLADILKKEWAEEEFARDTSPEYQKLREEAESLREALGGEEKVREMKKVGIGDLLKFVRKRKRLEELSQNVKGHISRMRKTPLRRKSEQDQLARLEQIKEETYHAREEELPGKKPEWFTAHWVLRLREYVRELEETGIVETSAIAKLEDTIREKFAEERFVALVGETGSGKTVAARKLARELGEGDFEFVSGTPFMTQEDLMSHLGLTAEELEPMTQVEKIRAAQERIDDIYSNMDDAERKQWKRSIESIIAGQQPTLKTETQLGPALRAAEAGKPLVVDEFNYIPPQALGMLNALIDAKPGQEFTAGDKQIKVKEGFRVIFTGNITKQNLQRYLGRQEMDPALINRLNSGLIEHHMPPQDIDTTFAQSIRREEEVAGEPVERDLFQIALAHMADERGNLAAPEGALDEAWRLSQGIALMQKIYAGERIRAEAAAGHTEFSLQKYHPSMRTLGRGILEKWRNDGFRYTLDWYIWDSLIRPASIIQPREAAQIFYILKERYQFFEDPEWADISVDTTTWEPRGFEEMRKKERKDFSADVPTKFYTPQELAEALAGREAPAAPEEQEEIFSEKMAEIDQILEGVKEEFSGIENLVERICEDAKVVAPKEAGASS